MAKTIKRQPFSVSTNQNAYPVVQTFAQSSFTGINEYENQITVDQNSVVDADNVHGDETGALVSRAPFVVKDDERFIIKRWQFGPYVLQLTRELFGKRDGLFVDLKGDAGGWGKSELVYRFQLACVSHDKIIDAPGDPYKEWYVPVEQFAHPHDLPDCACILHEDKVFCWLDREALSVFNLGTRSFVDGTQFLYQPLHELVVNGLITKQEAKNLLIDSYRRRYQLSGSTFVDWKELGSFPEVRLYYQQGDNNAFLYSRPGSEDQRLFLHPSFAIGDTHVSAVQTPRGTVFLRYDRDYNISVAIDGGLFRPLPALNKNGCFGRPILSDDGQCVIVFQYAAFLRYRLVRSELTDFETDLTWESTRYPMYSVGSGAEERMMMRGTHWFPPIAHFLDADNFVIFGAVLRADLRTDEALVWVHWLGSEAIDQLASVSLPTQKTDEGLLYPRYDDSLIRLQVLPVTETEDTRALVVGFIDTPNGLGTFVNTFDGADDILSLTLVEMNVYYDEETGNAENLAVNISKDDAVRFLSASDVRVAFNAEGRIFVGKMSIRGTTPTIDGRYIDQEVPSKILATTNEIITKDIIVKNDDIKNIMLPTAVPSLYSGALIKYEIRKKNTGETEVAYYRIYKTSASGDEVILSGEIENGDPVILADPGDYSLQDILAPKSPVKITSMGYRADGRRARYRPARMYFDPGRHIELEPGDVGYPVAELPDEGFGNHIVLPSTRPYPGEYESTGVLTVLSDVSPVLATEEELWLRQSETLWTSRLTEDVLEIEVPCGSGKLNTIVPKHSAVLDDTYFSFTQDGREVLAASSPRVADYTDNPLETLLYIAEDDAQRIANKITALHPLSDDILGIFTEEAVWYISRITDSTGSLLHTKPIKSKLPIACRDGDEIVTSPDGQGIILATPRGLAVLAPQDFIATTEKTLTYFSDVIRKRYEQFYNEPVTNGPLFLRHSERFSPAIKLTSYRQLLLLYKYMGQEIFVFDMKTGSWWHWTTPYPIQSLYTDNITLSVRFWIDFVTEKYAALIKSWAGCQYVLAEDAESVEYADYVYEQSYGGKLDVSSGQNVLELAQKNIRWHFVSQKLHFGGPMNYKCVKGLNLSLRADEVLQARLSVKVYRDLYHPATQEIIELPVNEVRTCMKPLNIPHLVYFQYALDNNGVAQKLRLDSLCVKYEVKEKIR